MEINGCVYVFGLLVKEDKSFDNVSLSITNFDTQLSLFSDISKSK